MSSPSHDEQTLADQPLDADDERVDCDEILHCERALRAWLTGAA